MNIPIFQVDAFSDTPFAGNPAGVCILPEAEEAGWMQSVASEMNLSETAFLSAVKGGYALRWFTPAIEVDLCGHATLASAHILWERGLVARTEPAQFETRSGRLTATWDAGWIEMDFPAETSAAVEPPAGLFEAMGVAPECVERNRLDYLVAVASEAVVRRAKPDFVALRTVETRGVMLTARAASDAYDFVSRYFAPRAGIDEDPVTGSAHCCLGPFWGRRLGKTALVGYQASARGGTVHVRLGGDRVFL